MEDREYYELLQQYMSSTPADRQAILSELDDDYITDFCVFLNNLSVKRQMEFEKVIDDVKNNDWRHTCRVCQFKDSLLDNDRFLQYNNEVLEHIAHAGLAIHDQVTILRDIRLQCMDYQRRTRVAQ